VAEVIQQDSPLFLDAIGNIIAYNTVDVKSRVTGELTKTFFKRGNLLTKGQQLFTIDPAPFEARVREAEAKLKKSKVQYEQAKREYVRFRALHSEKAISQEQLETKEVDMNSKLHEVELNQAELEIAKLNLGYCFIESPLEGESGDIYVDNYNIVTANQDKLVTIKQIRPIKVKFSVPGKYLDQVKKHYETGGIELLAFILDDERPEKGVLSMIDNSINLRTGMIMLEGNLENPESRLWPGQFVRIRLKLAVTQNALLIPNIAVNDGPEGQYVWLVQKDGTVAMRPVKVDRRNGALSVISQGVSLGDAVITDGQLTLYPGARIVTREQMRKMREEAASQKAYGPTDKKDDKGRK
jgi:multidrug efflux system membrane fusion protein